MYYKKRARIILLKNAMISFVSRKWKMWKTIVTPTTCYYCLFMNGRILSVDDPELAKIPVHPNCGCSIEAVRATRAGMATNDGTNGVDLFVALYGTLPENYLTKKEAKKLGWNPLLGNLAEVLPGMLIGGDIYKNRDKRLPDAPGRVWYEADFDYEGGYRNHCRLLYSNDGLVFVTYDHYLTFQEIVLEVIE